MCLVLRFERCDVVSNVHIATTLCPLDTCINVLDVDREGKWTVQTLNFIEHVRDIVILR